MLKDLESQIWDVAHQVEDVIDTFIISMANNNWRNGLGKLDKRYFMVLDDVWHTDVWDRIKTAFLNNSKGLAC
ncbi:hypothetical protein LguiB_010196 [Lonicera macranthoides]